VGSYADDPTAIQEPPPPFPRWCVSVCASVQGLASAVGTLLGTCVRIPCEVMKQRLQIGRHANVLEAMSAATAVEGGSRCAPQHLSVCLLGPRAPTAAVERGTLKSVCLLMPRWFTAPQGLSVW
jgi:hypothetical protein